jgi:cell division protein FtsZ
VIVTQQLEDPMANMPAPSADGSFRFELSTDITGEVKPVPPAPVQPAEPVMEYVEKPVSNVFTGFLNKPSNIYSEQQKAAQAAAQHPPVAQQPPVQQPEAPRPVAVQPEPEENIDLQLVIKDDMAPAPPTVAISTFDIQDDEEDQKRRAAERIQKLRKLSFNMNTTDPNNEFEAVPAYIRRNMDLFGNTLTSVENFYSKYTVKPDDNNEGKISSLNTFLDGKKPD